MRLIARYFLVLIVTMLACAPGAMAAGRKLLVNHTQYNLHATLVIRDSHDPRNQAGTKDVTLPPHHAEWVEYGDSVNIYLNGVRLVAIHNGEQIGQQYVVVNRGSYLDNILNRSNGLDFKLLDTNGLSFTIEGRNVHG